MDKLKEIYAGLAAFVVAALGIFVYFFTRRGDKVTELQAKVDLAQTEKETDVLESQINEAKTKQDDLAKQNSNLDKTAQDLQAKRDQVKEDAAKLTDPKAIAQYWEKN